MALASRLKKASVKRTTKGKPKRKGPVWQGPEKDGITFSLLSRFLVCRERFRLLVVEGLRPIPTFDHKPEYGRMWHACEEGFASEVASREGGAVDCAFANLGFCARNLCKQYPLQQEQIQYWYNVCKVAFPIYVDYWAKHPDVKKRTSLLQEQVFDVPYTLPSGRVVRLRGKWDGVDLIGGTKCYLCGGSGKQEHGTEKDPGPKSRMVTSKCAMCGGKKTVGKGRNQGIYLQENKTRGDINEQQMQRQLQFDLQTMLYLVGLDASMPQVGQTLEEVTIPQLITIPNQAQLRGVRYNAARRPLSGGVGSIRRHKATKTKPEETAKHFYARLGSIIKEDPDHFFMRWKVEVTAGDIERFKKEFLNPILEQLCDWWSWISSVSDKGFGHMSGMHYRTPYGFWNVLAEGGSTELDEYLATGSTTGLGRTDKLFSELE